MESIRLTPSPSQEVPNQLIFTLPERLGSGFVRIDRLSSGLNLLHMDLRPTRPIAIVGELFAGVCGIAFNLTGHSKIHSSGYWPSYSAQSGLTSHYVCSDPLLVKEDIGVTRKTKVAISFDKETLLDLADEDEEPFLPFLRGIGNQVLVTDQNKIETEMRRALNQIVMCPYRGKTRRLFLEGKTMEVFVRKLEQMRVKGKALPRQPRISKTDSERIHYAAELLVRDLVNPPDLTGLAGKAGMSRSKFYQSFKMVFGHSPLAHLRSRRLQTARKLLRQGSHNVTEVALAVGYNNLSNFAKIFAAEFGASPHEVI